MFKKITKGMKAHKITAIIVVAALMAVIYFAYGQFYSEEIGTNYEVEKAVKGNIETIVSTTGQVGDANQIDISAEVSGEITAVYVSEGDAVTAGQQIAQIDSTDLENDIYQAQLAVESAEVKLEQMKEDPDEYTILKAENELEAAKNDLTQLRLDQEHELETAQEDRDNAKENRSDLDKDDANYDTSYQNYTSQIKEAKRKIEEYKLNQPLQLEEAEAKITEKEKALEVAKEGADEKDIKLQEITIKEKKSKLYDFTAQRSDYTITAPKDGIIASLDINEDEAISANSTSTAATLISQTKNAEVTINEVDVPNVSVGQKVNLTFDALEDLKITGSVEEVDLIGTVEQGVVYHSVTISFDTQDERVKNGMTVNTDIITKSKEDVLVVSSSAVTSENDGDYIEIARDKNIKVNSSNIIEEVDTKMIKVETGITDDIDIEIISGLEEGDVIILKKNTVAEEDDTEEEQETSSILPMPGKNRK